MMSFVPRARVLLVALSISSFGCSVGCARPRHADVSLPPQSPKFTTNTVLNVSHVPVPAWSGQDREDEYAFEHFFYNVYGGSYLELGALNGVYLSNTKALHDFFGWRGLLIEANPVEYPNLVANRPYDKTVHAAVCARHSSVHYLSQNIDAATGGIWEFMPQSFRNQWHPTVDPTTLPLVACIPLKDILAAHNVTHINFFSLDVEGGELSVLESLDFETVTFDVIAAEADEHDPTKNKRVRDLLVARGYLFHEHSLRSDWFVRTGFKATTKQF